MSFNSNLSKIKCNTVWLVLSIVMTTLYFTGCSPMDKDDDGLDNETVITTIELEISNRSQFELHHVFVYDSDLTYQESTSLIESPLPIEQSMSITLDKGKYRVTITRQKNKDSGLLAFTTGPPLDLRSDSLLEYFDTQFRLTKLEKQDEDTDNSTTDNTTSEH